MTTQTSPQTRVPAPAPRASLPTRARNAATRLRVTIGVPGGLALAVILFTQLLGMVMEAALDSPGELALALTGAGALVLVLAGRWLRRLPGPASSTDFGQPGTDRLPTRRGAVILLGLDSSRPDSDTAALLMQLPSLEYLALVGNTDTLERGVAGRVADRLLPAAGHDLPPARIRRWEDGNGESVADAELATGEAIRWMLGRGLDRTEIVVDVSAGRRAMTFGAKDGADEHHVETQYLTCAWDTLANAPIPNTQVFKVIRVYDD